MFSNIRLGGRSLIFGNVMAIFGVSWEDLSCAMLELLGAIVGELGSYLDPPWASENLRSGKCRFYRGFISVFEDAIDQGIRLVSGAVLDLLLFDLF